MASNTATVHLKSQYANDPEFSVDDGEEFLTIGMDKTTGMLLLYDPNRDNAGFVSLAFDQVNQISSDRVHENELFKVWGEKEAWDQTPSPRFDI